jgi:anti-sigma regulatory factor (Ser/Thr protein kinase)
MASDRARAAENEGFKTPDPFQSRRVRVVLASVPESVSAARRAVDGFLEGNGSEELEMRVKLVVSELVTNAIVHGTPAGDVYLNLVLYHRHVHVSVRNFGMPISMMTFRSRRDDGGRGLDIVGELTDSWAIETGPAGTIVTTRIRR